MTKKTKGKPLSDGRPRSGTPPGCLVLFFSVFVVAGLAAAKTFLYDPLSEFSRARSWVATPCVVLSSEVKRLPGDDGETFRVAIRFRYSFGGATYESDRYDFGRGSSSGRRGKDAVVGRHPPGSGTTCWVNPEVPSQAVLDRSFGAWAWLALFPFPFLCGGAGGIWWVLASRRKERRERAERGGRYRDGAPPFAPPPPESAAGPVALKAKQGPGTRAAGAGCVALLWNGIVGVFVTLAAKLWMDGEGSWVMTLFLVPFVLVGLVLLWAFVSALRSLRAPRPHLTLEPARVPLGGAARLSWSFDGRSPSLSQLHVALEGFEEATYSRGTDRVTDRSRFHRSDVVLTGDAIGAVEGSADVTPPADLVPSFSAPSNRVVWLLRLDVQLHGREDVKEEYEIAVVPRETDPERSGR